MILHMAPAAARALGASPPRVLSNHGFLSPPNATAATVRFTRRTGGNRTVVLSVAPRSGRRDEWVNDSGGGRLVDEDMATLRRRIREAKAASESEEEDSVDGGVLGLPAEWTELERRHHGSYVAGVREVVGLLQALLMSTRPGLGAGVVALVLLSVPASVLLMSAQLIQAVGSMSSAVLDGR